MKSIQDLEEPSAPTVEVLERDRAWQGSGADLEATQVGSDGALEQVREPGSVVHPERMMFRADPGPILTRLNRYVRSDRT